VTGSSPSLAIAYMNVAVVPVFAVSSQRVVW